MLRGFIGCRKPLRAKDKLAFGAGQALLRIHCCPRNCSELGCHSDERVPLYALLVALMAGSILGCREIEFGRGIRRSFAALALPDPVSVVSSQLRFRFTRAHFPDCIWKKPKWLTFVTFFVGGRTPLLPLQQGGYNRRISSELIDHARLVPSSATFRSRRIGRRRECVRENSTAGEAPTVSWRPTSGGKNR